MGRAVVTLFVLLLFAGVSGCATPRYAVPDADAALSAEAEAALASDAMAVALERRARVYDLAWPVVTANAGLCSDTAPRIGVVLADRAQLARLAGGLEPAVLERLGTPEGLRVVHAHAGGPAHAAGLRAGQMVDAVMGEAISDPDAAVKRLRAALEGGEAATIEANGLTYEMEGVPACDIAIKVSSSQAINATALGDIVIYTGLIRSLGDEALRSVIAHELAHVVAGHKAKYARNALVTGAPVVGPVVYYGARLTDRVLSLVGIERDRPLSAGALRALAPWTEDFEAEADYLGLYLHARAGGDVEAAAEAFEVMGREGPRAISVRATHPLLPKRLARHRATAAEIAAKRAAGVPLLPERAE